MYNKGKRYDKMYHNGKLYNKAFRNGKQILGSSSILEGAELYLPLDSPDNRVTMFNNPSYVTGKKENAVSFNGINQYASLPGYNILNSSAVSFGCWVKYDSPQIKFAGIFGKSVYNSFAGRWNISLTENNRLGVVYQSNTDQSITVTTDTVDMSSYYNQWVHIVGVINKTTQTVKLYINGVLKRTTTGVSPQNTPDTNNNLFLGTYGNSTGSGSQIPFKGIIDEVFFMRKALSDTEVMQLYNEYEQTPPLMD